MSDGDTVELVKVDSFAVAPLGGWLCGDAWTPRHGGDECVNKVVTMADRPFVNVVGGGGGGLSGPQHQPRRIRLDVATIRSIFVQHPRVFERFQRKVPGEMSESQFWSEYFHAIAFRGGDGQPTSAAAAAEAAVAAAAATANFSVVSGVFFFVFLCCFLFFGMMLMLLLSNSPNRAAVLSCSFQ